MYMFNSSSIEHLEKWQKKVIHFMMTVWKRELLASVLLPPLRFFFTEKVICYHCGRGGHIVLECTAPAPVLGMGCGHGAGWRGRGGRGGGGCGCRDSNRQQENQESTWLTDSETDHAMTPHYEHDSDDDFDKYCEVYYELNDPEVKWRIKPR